VQELRDSFTLVGDCTGIYHEFGAVCLMKCGNGRIVWNMTGICKGSERQQSV